ncbi:Uncharacterised protein [Mycobacteroides abscessus subsp. abscessus]|nr:Uncharacterised protein [Mycobacteroides abscessus subsp. abscessus]
MPVLQIHPPVFDAHHGAHESRLGVLDHGPNSRGNLRRARTPRGVRVIGQDIGSITVSHPAIVGMRPGRIALRRARVTRP